MIFRGVQNTGRGVRKQFLILAQSPKATFIELDKNVPGGSFLICKNVKLKNLQIMYSI